MIKRGDMEEEQALATSKRKEESMTASKHMEITLTWRRPALQGTLVLSTIFGKRPAVTLGTWSE